MGTGKRELRAAMRKKLQACAPDAQETGGQSITRHLEPVLQNIPPDKPVALFSSLFYELDTSPMDVRLRGLGIDRAYPTIENNQLVFRRLGADYSLESLVTGTFNVRVPPPTCPEVRLADCHLIFVPGLAFDERGTRLGQGKAYYDRALSAIPPDALEPLIIGLFLDCQGCALLPKEAHDRTLNHLCTPDRGLWRPSLKTDGNHQLQERKI